MALLPVTLRRRLRDSGFTEVQTDALQETSEVTASLAREGLVKETNAQDEYFALRNEISDVRSEVGGVRNEIALLRAEMNAIKWWLFASTAGLITAATAAIIAAIAVWG